MRLRQVVLVAHDLEPTVASLRDALDIDVCFRDPSVGEFGLQNALLAAGDTFIEVVSPTQPDTAAGRLLERRGGDGGYMVMVQADGLDDLNRLRSRLAGLGVRAIWQGDFPEISGTHLHPKDIGGAIVSMDAPQPAESWQWAGASWQDHVRTDTVSEVTGVVIGADDPPAMAARWAEVLDQPLAEPTVIALHRGRISFEVAGPRGEGVDAFELLATDRSRAGHVAVAGVELRWV